MLTVPVALTQLKCEGPESTRALCCLALNGMTAVMTAVLPKVMGVMSQQTSVTLEASARAQASCFLRA